MTVVTDVVANAPPPDARYEWRALALYAGESEWTEVGRSASREVARLLARNTTAKFAKRAIQQIITSPSTNWLATVNRPIEV